MSQAALIYNYSKRVEDEIKKVKEDTWNAESLYKYYESRVADGISAARILKCLCTLRRCSQILGKPFDVATKDDIIKVITKVETSNYSPHTKRDYKIILKKFYKWLKNTDEGYPPEVKWIKSGKKIPNLLSKGQLLTLEEIHRIADAALTLRDKAFILVLFESGRRVGEILTLKVGDIEFDDIGARFIVDGKTGKWHCRVIASSPKLATWIDNHPFRNNPSAPLWIGLGSTNQLKQISYDGARTMLLECAKKAGLTKRVHFHLFRHSRATQCSTLLTQAQMNQVFGWIQGSNVPAVYVHLAGEDLDRAVMTLNGIKEKNSQTTLFKAETCPRCKSDNSPDAKFCNRCGCVLDMAQAIKLDEARSKIDDMLNKLTEDPKKLEKLLALIEH